MRVSSGDQDGAVGALAQERPWRAACQRHEHYSRSRYSWLRLNQISAPSPEKPKLRRMDPAAVERRNIRREVDESPGAHLAHPEVVLAFAVGEEGHEPSHPAKSRRPVPCPPNR